MRHPGRRAAELFGKFAAHKTLCCLGFGAFILIARAALLPVWPVPQPTIYDEFCYILQADTFSHGRLTNPQHAAWPFFESIYVLQRPTYTAKYQPAQGFVMAIGQKALGNPWFGVWLSCGLLAAALCWAAQGWLSPIWALAAACLPLQLCFYLYWMNSYWGGSVTALGGALVIGSWARLRGSDQSRPRVLSFLLGLGCVILLLTRPYEGGLLALPVLWFLRKELKAASTWAPLAICLLCGLAFTCFYNYRVTGNPLRLPYQEYFHQYETTPQFNILPVSSGARILRHRDFELLDKGWLFDAWQKARTPRFLLTRVHDWYITLKHFLGGGLPLIPLALFAPWLLLRKGTRQLALLAAIIVAGSFVEVAQYPHYAAPFLAVFAILAAESLKRAGKAGVALLLASLAYAGGGDARAIYQKTTPDRFASGNSRKGEIERKLASQYPEGSLIFVRYTKVLIPHEEWIYNRADIDRSPVIWAQDMGDRENRHLMAYFPKRAFLLFRPDDSISSLTPYP